MEGLRPALILDQVGDDGDVDELAVVGLDAPIDLEDEQNERQDQRDARKGQDPENHLDDAEHQRLGVVRFYERAVLFVLHKHQDDRDNGRQDIV